MSNCIFKIVVELRYSSTEPKVLFSVNRCPLNYQKLTRHRPCKDDANSHYENLPMQYTRNFLALKIENLQQKNLDIFLIFAQNIDCEYTLEPPRRGGSNEYPQSMFWSKNKRGGSNEYPQSMFWSKNKKNRFNPAYPSFAI